MMQSSAAPTVHAEARDGVAILTLDRPHVLNALDYATLDAIAALLDEIEGDEAVRAVVLTGRGRAFSAGADIREFRVSIARGVDVAVREFCRRGQRVTARIEAFSKPVVAAVNGLAYGGGCELVEATHLGVAADDATFAKAELRLGLPPNFGGTQRLARLAGRKRALEFILTTRPFDAATACDAGLVNRVVARERVLDEACALARDASAFSRVATAAALHAVTRGLNASIEEGLAIEAAAFARCAASRDILEGTAAFLERRPPVFVDG